MGILVPVCCRDVVRYVSHAVLTAGEKRRVVGIVDREGFVYSEADTNKHYLWANRNHWMWMTRDAAGSSWVCKLLCYRDSDAEHHEEEIRCVTESVLVSTVKSLLLPVSRVIRVPGIGHVLVMPFVGKSLFSLSRRQRDGWARNWITVKKVMMQILEGMAFWHRHGWLHGDIKWSHFLLDDDDQVWIIDAGSARHGVSGGGFKGGTTVTGVRGTEGYAAPEVGAEQEVDTQADMYSLGQVFSEIYRRVRGDAEGWDSDAGDVATTPRKGPTPPSAEELRAFNDLVASLCKIMPCDRLTARQALSHALFARANRDDSSGSPASSVTMEMDEHAHGT